jgi:hypothetical protein
MGIRKFAGALLIGSVAAAVAAVPAAAQTVTFSTSGTFAGGSCSPTMCAFGGFTLTYNAQGSASWAAPTDVTLGSFNLGCFACASGTQADILAGSMFTLTITQTAPTGGTGSFTGSVAGALKWDPSGSSLFWTPNSGSVSIGGVTYALIETDAGGGTLGINIGAPITAAGGNPSTTLVKDDIDVTATPEPATVALMATGLFGLVPLIRRRRKV